MYKLDSIIKLDTQTHTIGFLAWYPPAYRRIINVVNTIIIPLIRSLLIMQNSKNNPIGIDVNIKLKAAYS